MSLSFFNKCKIQYEWWNALLWVEKTISPLMSWNHVFSLPHLKPLLYWLLDLLAVLQQNYRAENRFLLRRAFHEDFTVVINGSFSCLCFETPKQSMCLFPPPADASIAGALLPSTAATQSVKPRLNVVKLRCGRRLLGMHLNISWLSSNRIEVKRGQVSEKRLYPHISHFTHEAPIWIWDYKSS